MATLEQYGSDFAAQRGIDINRPEVQSLITEAAADLRAEAAGLGDDEIIAQYGPALLEEFGRNMGGSQAPVPAAETQVAPVAAQAVTPPPTPTPTPATAAAADPAFSFERYRQLQQEKNTRFSPEAEQAAKDQARQNNVWNEAGRNLSAGYRVAASPAANKVLDDQYAANVATANRPYDDWQTKKKEFVARIEEEIRGGQIQQQDVERQLKALGLEQALQEKSSKAAIAQAEGDPNSATSEAMRQLARQYSPEFVEGLGARFNTLTAAQLKAQLPSLEKQYTKRIEQQKAEADRVEKGLDRESREKIASANNASRIEAANIRKAGSGEAGPKTSDVLRAQRDVANLDKQGRVEEDKVLAAQESIGLLREMQDLVKGGLVTGPVVGADGYIGKAATFLSGDRQRANQIGAQLVASMAKTFGAAPSDAENRLIREANTVLQQDNPGPALQSLIARFERQVQQNQRDVQNIERQKQATLGAVGAAPAQAPSSRSNVVNSQAAYDALPSGATYTGPDGKTYRKK